MALIRTVINSFENITFCNSEIYARIRNNSQNNTIQAVRLRLWVWNGELNKTLFEPNHTFFKNKVTAQDTYIEFEFSSFIKSFLVNPPNAINTNQPQFLYNQNGLASITGQGVFWQIEAEIFNSASTEIQSSNTNFATLGYKFNFETKMQTANVVTNSGTGFNEITSKYYNPKINNYLLQSFNFDRALNECTTANIINKDAVNVSNFLQRDSRFPLLIVFINKVGLFEMFTPNGKYVQSVKIKSDNQNINYRDSQNVNSQYQHSKTTVFDSVTQNHTINTGLLLPKMCEIVEQIIYSPKIYLVKFRGDLVDNSSVGITIDNSFESIDSMDITIDNETITSESIGFYKDFQQIPVVCTENDYVFKNQYNNYSAIEYTLKFDETNDKI